MMTITIKEPLTVTAIPCIMESWLGQIVLVSKLGDDIYATVLSNKNGSDTSVGNTWKTELKPTEYFPLPEGYEITLKN